MHSAQLYDPVHAAPPRRQGQQLFFPCILYTQSESLQCSIELRDYFEEIIDYQHAQRSTLRRIGHFRAHPQKNGPIR